MCLAMRIALAEIDSSLSPSPLGWVAKETHKLLVLFFIEANEENSLQVP